MQYRTVPKTGDQFSRLGFGCMRLPSSRFGSVNIKEAHRLIHEAIDLGINYFDNAWFYHGGKSESILGEAIQGERRQKIHLATKLPQHIIHNRNEMEQTLDQQLKSLRTETIDYYLIHALPHMARWEELEKIGIREFLEAAQNAGKVRHIGFSFHGTATEFCKIVDAYPWVSCLVQYNYLDTHTQAGTEGVKYAASKEIAVMVMEPLRGGLLGGQLPKKAQALFDAYPTKRSAADWALRWLWDQPEVTMVLSGLNRSDHLRENIATADETTPGTMTEEEHQVIEQVRGVFEERIQVPCTACAYCMPCPANVNIPGCFMHYNSGYLLDNRVMTIGMYLAMHDIFQAGNPTLASQCTGCGKCEKICPQGIKVPEELAKVRQEFEGRFTTPLLKRLIRFVMNRRKLK